MDSRITVLMKSVRITAPAVFFVLAALVMMIFISVTPEIVPPKGGPPLGPPSKAKREALAIALEMNKLVISLVSLIFGAVGMLVIAKDEVRQLRRAQNALVLATLLAASAAIYFSYVVYDKTLTMLSNNFLELGDSSLRWSRLFQVNALGLSLVTLAALFLTFSTRKNEVAQ